MTMHESSCRVVSHCLRVADWTMRTNFMSWELLANDMVELCRIQYEQCQNLNSKRMRLIT